MECKKCANYLNHMDCLLSDDELNKRILNTTSKKVLRDLLQLKLKKITEGNGTKISYNLATFYKDQNEETDNLDLLCEIIDICFRVVQDPDNILMELIDFLNISFATNNYNTSQSDLIYNLFCGLINFLYKERFKQLIIQQLNKADLHTFLVDYLVKKKCSKKFVDLLVLKKYLSFLKVDEQVLLINNLLENFKLVDDLEVISCLLYEIDNDIFKSVVLHRNSAFMTNHFYHYLAYDCFVNGNSTILKQAQFMLKLIIDYVNQNEEAPIFIKDGKGSNKSWEDFFFLLQISREKQLHLVQPALDLLPSLEHLHDIWRIAIYKIFLKHVQNVVSYSTAIFIFEKEPISIFLEHLLQDFFMGINRNEYNGISNKMFFELKKYSERFLLENNDYFIKNMVQTSFNPLVLWKLLSSIVNDNFEISLQAYTTICDYLSNLPHVYIRTACKTLITNEVIKKNFGDTEQDYYSEYLPIILSESSLEILNKIPYIKKYFFMFVNDNIINWDFYKFKMYIDIALKLDWELKLDTTLLSKFQLCYIYLNSPQSFTAKRGAFIIHHLVDSLFLKNEPEAIYADIIFEFLNSDLPNTCPEICEKVLIKLEVRENLSACKSSNSTLFALFLIEKYNFMEKPTEKLKVYKTIEDILFENHKPDIDGRFYIQFLKLSVKYSDLNLDKLKHIFETQCDEILAKVFIYIECIDFEKESVLTLLEFFVDELLKLRKSLFFKKAVINFIYAVFNYDTFVKIQRKADSFIKKILTILQELMETFNFICYDLTKALFDLAKCKGFVNNENLELILPTLLELYLQGIIVKKEDRNEYYVLEEIHKKISSLQDNINKINFKVRIMSLDTIKLFLTECKSPTFFETVIERYNKNFGKRYFPDSMLHYEKLRLVQILLVCFWEYKCESRLERQIKFCIRSLTEENHQNCVKQLLQFLLLLSLNELDQNSKQQEFRKILEKIKLSSTNKNQLLVATFLPILHHLALKNDSFMPEYVKTVLPYTMGANFKLRSYAQFSLRLLLVKSGNTDCNYLKDCLELVLTENESAILSAIKTDKYFMGIDNLKKYYSMNTILMHIPQLNGVNDIEWSGYPTIIGLDKNCEVPNCKDNDNNVLDTSESNDVKNMNTTFMQKKITPYKSNTENNVVSSGLVIVASLLDKATNIGGLSRTCEIFGVNQLVLHDGNIVKNKEFLSLSMSSESWVQFLEVKKEGLGEYLINMRKVGYKIIGAEQTSSSVKLNRFIFPKNVVVVLGNEKEGIPAHLFSYLDATVEIPQMGLTRSLNAHVAGATFIWEYSKQHYGNSPLFQ